MVSAPIRITAEFIREAATQSAVRAGVNQVAAKIRSEAAQGYARDNRDVEVTVEAGTRGGGKAAGFQRPYANVVVHSGDDSAGEAEFGGSRRSGSRSLMRAAEKYR